VRLKGSERMSEDSDFVDAVLARAAGRPPIGQSGIER
jgi:hypothetical protein